MVHDDDLETGARQVAGGDFETEGLVEDWHQSVAFGGRFPLLLAFAVVDQVDFHVGACRREGERGREGGRGREREGERERGREGEGERERGREREGGREGERGREREREREGEIIGERKEAINSLTHTLINACFDT